MLAYVSESVHVKIRIYSQRTPNKMGFVVFVCSKYALIKYLAARAAEPHGQYRKVQQFQNSPNLGVTRQRQGPTHSEAASFRGAPRPMPKQKTMGCHASAKVQLIVKKPQQNVPAPAVPHGSPIPSHVPSRPFSPSSEHSQLSWVQGVCRNLHRLVLQRTHGACSPNPAVEDANTVKYHCGLARTTHSKRTCLKNEHGGTATAFGQGQK